MTITITTAEDLLKPKPPVGLKVLLLGESGSGKTYSLRTLVDAGLELFVIQTEPGGTVLEDLPRESYHSHYVKTAAPSWTAMLDSAKKINTLSMKSLCDLPGINKQEYAQWMEVIATLGDFKCDRCQRSFGDASLWDSTRVLVIDSLSGLNIMAMDLVVGSKPVKSMADWGIAMDNLSRLINKVATDTKCHFVLTAHLEPERDEVTGRVQNMPSTLGRKLAPVLPRFFDNVIQTIREGNTFKWSTGASNVAVKARDLPISENLAPSFAQMLTHWNAKLNTAASPASPQGGTSTSQALKDHLSAI
jgi:hypothetical protein